MNRLEMETMYGETAPITEKTIDNMFLTNGIPLTHIARSSAKTTMSMKQLCDLVQGVVYKERMSMKESLTNLVKEREGLFFDEFMKISDHDMTEMYPEVLWYNLNDVLATKNGMKNLVAADTETAEEKKERERESYLKYKEFVMKKKGHKGGFR